LFISVHYTTVTSAYNCQFDMTRCRFFGKCRMVSFQTTHIFRRRRCQRPTEGTVK